MLSDIYKKHNRLFMVTTVEGWKRKGNNKKCLMALLWLKPSTEYSSFEGGQIRNAIRTCKLPGNHITDLSAGMTSTLQI